VVYVATRVVPVVAKDWSGKKRSLKYLKKKREIDKEGPLRNQGIRKEKVREQEWGRKTWQGY